MSITSRREFLYQMAGTAALAVIAPSCLGSKKTQASAKPFFEISLAEWSFHKALFAKQMTNLDFPVIARQKFDISAVEYVNQFFMDKAKDTVYLNELLKRCTDNGVKNHLIMCDGEGELGNLDKSKRMEAVEKHYKWVDAAKYLGCITIRVNTFGQGDPMEVQKAAAESLSVLGEYAAKQNMNVIVENHGGNTSNGQWMVGLMKAVGRSNVGVLPDFNNFCIRRDGGQQWEGKCVEQYDRYKGVQEMMPYAKGASAKTMDFDAQGNCVETDYNKMFDIIKSSGFHGYIGIEYEGEHLGEEEGIRKTKALLEKVAARYA